MKRIKIISLFMAVVVMLTYHIDMLALAEEYEENLYKMNTNCDASQTFIENERNANETYNDLLDSFRNNGAAEISVCGDSESYEYSVEGIYADDFPNDYAGAYINTYGDLVIMVTEETMKSGNTSMETETSVLAQSEDVYYQSAEYSYAELVNLMTSIYEYCASDEYKNADFTIYGYEIRDELNRVVVYLDSIDEEAISQVKEGVTGDDAILFEFQESGDEETYSLNCGSAIGKTQNSMGFSVGYRATYDNAGGNAINGFITCGHAFVNSANGTKVYCSSGQVGTLVKSKYQYSGKVDAAFVQLSSGSEVSNYVNSSSITVNKSFVISKAAGSLVYMQGMTSGKSIGTVVSASYTSSSAGLVTLTDMVKTNYASAGGDSGGIVYAELMDGVSVYYVTGIQSRKATDNSYSVYCKAANINSALGISIR